MTAAREGRFDSEGWRVRKDGSKFWASVVIDPIRADDGELIGFAKITRDVTERKLAAEKLDLARETLFQSQKMDAIGQLTGGVAHDFNNLLSAVLGSLELLRRRLPNDPKMLRLLDNASNGARRGAVLTQRMLSFARKQDLKLVAVDVSALVDSMRDFLESSLGASILIETQFPQGLRRVVGDPNQLELAILNLAVNARDSMPGGGKIVIAGRETVEATGLEPKHFVCLSLTDEGTGMDAATLQQAMEPFFTTKGVGKGTGLGLSMVHGMAQQLGGKLVLASKVGEGTTAELFLPVAEGGRDAASEGHPRAEPEGDQPRLRVLAVDDDGLVLLNTAAMLEDLGHEVVEASSGKAALDIFHAGPAFDLVVTDQAMPGMSGLELGAQLWSQRPDLPIIVATGYGELPRQPGQSYVKLSKPFLQQNLIEAITAAMSAHRG